MRKHLRLIAVMALCLLLFAGCELAAEKQIQCEGLAMTVPGSFMDLGSQDYAANFTFLYGFGDMAVSGLKEDISIYREQFPDITLADYADLIVEYNALDTEVVEKNGVLTFTYEAASEDETFTYVAGVYECSDAFWLVQFFCTTDEKDAHMEDFYTWLATVQVE